MCPSSNTLISLFAKKYILSKEAMKKGDVKLTLLEWLY